MGDGIKVSGRFRGHSSRLRRRRGKTRRQTENAGMGISRSKRRCGTHNKVSGNG
jgi:hypothetical protein